MLRLVRRGTHRGKLVSARFLVRLLGRRLGRVRLLLDAWFMRARLIEAALADGHTVIGRARRDLALYAVPRPPRRRRRGRPRKYGPRMTPERVEALPVHRSARILYGKLEVARYRSCRVAAQGKRMRPICSYCPTRVGCVRVSNDWKSRGFTDAASSAGPRS